jgi:hypothetical protein
MRRQWAAVVDALRGVWSTAQSIKPITAPAWEVGWMAVAAPPAWAADHASR